MVLIKQNQSPKLGRQHNLTLTILVAILLACEQVLCQNDRGLSTVETRGANDKEVGLSSTRNIYSPRLTSPNQFMHFGKRPSEPLASATKLIQAPRVYDLYRREQLQQQPLENVFPFLFSIELERGQTLSALPEADEGDYKFIIPRGNNLLYNSATYQHLKPQQLQQLQQFHNLPTTFDQRARLSQRAYIGAKSSRLTSANYAGSDGSENSGNDNSNNDNSNLSDEQVNQIGYQTQNDDISLATRSLNQNRLVNSYPVPIKGFVSEVLFGRQNSPSLGLGPYIKKAEPKENMFMHFGRK